MLCTQLDSIYWKQSKEIQDTIQYSIQKLISGTGTFILTVLDMNFGIFWMNLICL